MIPLYFISSTNPSARRKSRCFLTRKHQWLHVERDYISSLLCFTDHERALQIAGYVEPVCENHRTQVFRVDGLVFPKEEHNPYTQSPLNCVEPESGLKFVHADFGKYRYYVIRAAGTPYFYWNRHGTHRLCESITRASLYDDAADAKRYLRCIQPSDDVALSFGKGSIFYAGSDFQWHIEKRHGLLLEDGGSPRMRHLVSPESPWEYSDFVVCPDITKLR